MTFAVITTTPSNFLVVGMDLFVETTGDLYIEARVGDSNSAAFADLNLCGNVKDYGTPDPGIREIVIDCDGTGMVGNKIGLFVEQKTSGTPPVPVKYYHVLLVGTGRKYYGEILKQLSSNF